MSRMSVKGVQNKTRTHCLGCATLPFRCENNGNQFSVRGRGRCHLNTFHWISSITFLLWIKLSADRRNESISLYESRGGAVGLANDCRQNAVELSSSAVRTKNCHFFIWSSTTLWPTLPHKQSVPEALSRKVNRPGREADNLLLRSVEVRKTWFYISTRPYVVIA